MLDQDGFKWYAARDVATFAMLTTGFREMGAELGVSDGRPLHPRDLDRVFIAVNASAGGVAHATVGTGANSVEAICRWELLEAVVRLALAKYVEASAPAAPKAACAADAVEMLAHEHLSRLADLVPDPDDFRRAALYTRETECVFVLRRLELQLVFAHTCFRTSKTGASDSSRAGEGVGGGTTGGGGRKIAVFGEADGEASVASGGTMPSFASATTTVAMVRAAREFA